MNIKRHRGLPRRRRNSRLSLARPVFRGLRCSLQRPMPRDERHPVRGERAERGFRSCARVRSLRPRLRRQRSALEMVLRNAAGRESTRIAGITTLEIADESVGDKSLVVFDSPNDIKGTALLSHAQILDPDDQWLYPAGAEARQAHLLGQQVRPVRRLGVRVRGLHRARAQQVRLHWLARRRSRICCDVVERTPRYENSGYTRQVSWVDQDVFQVRKVEFYDRRGDLLKTLSLRLSRIRRRLAQHRMEMVNHQTGKSTDLVYGDYEFNVGLDDDDFERGILTRLR